MPFFGSTPQTGSGVSSSPSGSGSSFFGGSSSTGSAISAVKENGSALLPGQGGSEETGVLIFDHQQHSGDGGGEPIAERGTGDEAANLYREFDALGHDVTTTAETDGAALAPLLADVAAFVLPEAEAGNVFPDGDTVLDFVEGGGNLLFFGFSGASTNGSQLNFINETFDLGLTSSGSGNYVLSPDALPEFLGGPAQLGHNNGTSTLATGDLPDDAVVIYGDGDDAVLVFMPQEDGQLIFLGWDYFNSSGQDNGWNDAFETVAELTAEIEVTGVEAPAIGTSFFGFDAG